jgi:RNA polymerase sigma-70 factor (ECF subfamily)
MTRADFDALYREHYHHVLALCRRMLGGATDPEDATQEVFMRGYRSIGSYQRQRPFAPWIRSIAANHCIDLLRQRTRLEDLVDSSADGEAAALNAADPADDGLAALVTARHADAIVRAVDALPDKYRLPVVMAYYADASYDEIAAALDTSRNHVGVLLLRARERLRRDLAHLEEEI